MGTNFKKRRWITPVALFAWVAISYFVARSNLPFSSRWVLLGLLMTAIVLVLGIAITGRFWAILVDGRNCMSLSKFQLVLWTVLILSAFLTIAVARIYAGEIADPLAIPMDERLWALLGISTAALVGTPLVHRKKETTAPPANNDQALRAAQVRTEVANGYEHGLLFFKPTLDDARVEDMFTGEETGDAGRVDLAKVQMFFFTMIAALTYAVALYQRFNTKDVAALGFPDLSTGLLAVLGISHATHLVGKIPDRTG